MWRCSSPLSGSTGWVASYLSLNCAAPRASVGDVEIHVVQTPDGRSVRQAVCMGGSEDALPALIEPQLTGMSVQSLGLEGFEEVRTAQGIVFYRQGWWCRTR